jgi:hypothetical protein
LAEASAAVMRYTARPYKKLAFGARSFPDVELSVGTTVTGQPNTVGALGLATA